MPSVTYVRSNTGNRGNDSSIKGRESALGPVHLYQGLPHAGHFARPFTELRKGSSLDGQSCPDNVERVGEGNRGDTGKTTADQPREGRERVAGMPLKDVPLVKVVASELYCRVRDNSDAIGTVAGHEAPPALFPPHLGQRLAHTELVGFAPIALYLVENLETLEWRDYRSGNGTGDTAGAKGSHCRLRDCGSELVGGAHFLDGRYG